MFRANQYDNSQPDGFSVLEIQGAEKAGQNAPRLFVPLKRTELRGEASGPLAALRLTQIFGYTATQSDKTLEAVYRFPLPGDAAVTGVTVQFGEVEIRAELKERERAEADYETAKREGRQAALATRESPNVFTLRLAGLQPDQEIRVETAYTLLARMEGSDWTLRLPLTTAPRYTRGDEANSRHAQGQPLALLRDPGHRFALDMTFRDAEKIASSTHALTLQNELETDAETGVGNRITRVQLRDGEVMPDRDCVILWRTRQDAQHPALHLYLQPDKDAKQVYFLALAAPPRQPAAPLVSREAILLVDHSGSMGGAKWDASDWAVTQFLNSLTPQDTFALGLFHDSVRWFAKRPVSADAANVEAAQKFLMNKDSGGTELGVALEQALGQARREGEISRHVLVVTDTAVTDVGRLLNLVEKEAARKDGRRVSVLCIDEAPNSQLAYQLTERGGGVVKFLTSDSSEEDITTALDRILEDWSAPVLTGLRLEVNRANAQATGKSGASIDGGSRIEIGDLPAGRAVWVAGRAPLGDTPDLSFRLTTADGRELAARRMDLNRAGEAAGIKALFGASRILALEYLTTGHFDGADLKKKLTQLGYDAEAELAGRAKSPALYAENQQRNDSAALKGLLTREALTFGLASSETAFVATRTEAGKAIESTTLVANALPSGWSDDFEDAPGTMLFCASAAPVSAPAPSALYCLEESEASFDLMDVMLAPPRPSGMARAAGKLRAGAGAFLAKSAASPMAPSLRPAQSAPPTEFLFSGNPVFAGQEAVLFDTARAEDAARFSGAREISRLWALFVNPADGAAPDSGLVLLVYVDDLSTPRARVRLSDLMRQGGARPLNIHRAAHHVVRLVLEDANGAWTQQAPELSVTLE